MTDRFTRLRRIAAAGIAAAGMLAPVAVQAVPAYPGIIRTTQPDGTVVEIVMRGDERGHRTYTTDGYLLIRDAEGYMSYAVADADGLPAVSAMRPSASAAMRPASETAFVAALDRNAITAAFDRADLMRSSATRAGGENTRYLFSGAAFPAKGSPQGLVVLVEFQDKAFSMSDPQEYFSRMLNEEGFSDLGATGSARDFFVENSGGVFTPQFDVYGPIKLANRMSYYGGNDDAGNDLRPEEMVIEACRALDDTVDFTVYDTDGDGQIDNVFVFYAGYGEADSNLPNTVWPHSADIVDFQLGTDYYFDGKLLNRYACTNEVDHQYLRTDGIGTFVHEFSHVMGLPDLYSTDYSKAFTPGAYSTLDVGPYNNQGRTPPHYSSFERYCLDWLEPEPLTEEGEYTLEAIHKSNKAYIVGTDKETEFYLFENRQQECCDAYLPGHGLMVWHVDYVQKVWDNNIVNNRATHQYVDLVEADCDYDEKSRGGDLFPGTSNVTEFTRTSIPAIRAWSGAPISVGLSGIREEDGVVSFRVVIDNSGVSSVASAADGILAEGDAIRNATGSPVAVFDLAGARVADVASGASVRLPAGLYIVSGPDGSLKVALH